MSTPVFDIQPIGRFRGESEPVKRPKEIACFSYDEKHEFRLDDSSLQWYYPPRLGADLSRGFDKFDKHDESVDEHLDSLLETIAAHEEEEGKKIDANIVTWRGMMTKIMSVPFEDRDGFEMNATLYQDDFKSKQFAKEQQNKQQRGRRGQFSPEVMTYWGYKFETLSCLPRPWGEVSREFIENRDEIIVNNKAQYCSVVRTGIGKTVLCLGGEVDAIWDSKPSQKGAPINWVELKTSAEIHDDRGMSNFERKLMKFWIQSFLLGVPKIIVGFRSQGGILTKLEEIQTASIPATAAKRGVRSWDANMCINFASAFLDWLTNTINDEGVWKIRRRAGSSSIEVFQVEEVGHGSILTEQFINWRIKHSLSSTDTT
ncbi:RAI1 like PD-XK nuclease-domain-containing protein [Xylaria sp. FL0043]|nr:RAI1 like PD-XK nuclease-domain-containing protein [Xylaria sp. FL0043]